jgi:muconolactone delta-isomerase
MNPFEQLAAEQTSNPVKAKQRAAEKRRAKSAQAEKELEDEGKLLVLYRRYKRQQVQSLLNGPRGPQVSALAAIMRTMTLESAPGLIRYARGSAWVTELSTDEKHILLGMIGRAITKVREKAGLPPFDDGLPGEPPKAFERIKTILGVR